MIIWSAPELPPGEAFFEGITRTLNVMGIPDDCRVGNLSMALTVIATSEDSISPVISSFLARSIEPPNLSCSQIYQRVF